MAVWGQKHTHGHNSVPQKLFQRFLIEGKQKTPTNTKDKEKDHP